MRHPGLSSISHPYKFMDGDSGQSRARPFVTWTLTPQSTAAAAAAAGGWTGSISLPNSDQRPALIREAYRSLRQEWFGFTGERRKAWAAGGPL